MRGPTTSGRRLTTLVALVALVLGATALGAAAQTTTTVGPDDAGSTLRPGEQVVTQQKAGQLVVISAAGQSRLLNGNLENPRGVVVLEDHSVLVAESTANRISGVDGPFGPRPAPVVSFPSPEALAAGADGSVYVTSLNGGTVARLDVATRAVTTVADGFVRPTGLAVQGGAVYVGDAGTGTIVRINQDGSKETVAQNIGTPTGLAIGPDRTIYVADYLGKRILKLDAGGQQTELARVDDPVQVALVPAEPKGNEPFVLAVTMVDGVIQLDQQGQPVGRKVVFPRTAAVGIATVPGGPPVAPSTSVAGGTAGSTPSSAAATTTSVVRSAPEEAGGTSAAGVLAGAIAVLFVLGGLAAGALVLSRRGRSGFEAGFGDLDSSHLSMSDAMGPCAAEEVELAESESALAQVLDQRDSAVRRKQEATTRVTKAASRREEARLGLEKVSAARPAAELGDRFTVTDLGLGTDEGRAALRAFGQQEMTADQLRRRWDQLGEVQALRLVAGTDADSPTAASPPAWSEARAAVLLDLEAESELAQAARDVADADHDVERLASREQQARERIATAKEALEACRERAHQAAAALAARQDEARRRAEAAGEGAAATAAAAGATAAGAKAGDAKPGDAKAGDAKAGAKAGDAKTGAKPGDAKPAPPSGKPGAAKPGDAKPPDAKPGAAKPGDAKPADAKPGAAKPGDAKPADAKPGAAKPGDAKPADAKPGAAKPGDAKPADAKPGDAKPAAAKPAAAKPADAKPAPPAAKPGDAKPADAKSAPPAAKPGAAKPTDANPGDAKPAPSDAKPADAKPADAKPGDAKPAPPAAKPGDAKPGDAKPAPPAAKPGDAKPADAKPAPPAAKPADAKPADAKPADAKPAPPAAKPDGPGEPRPPRFL